MSQFKSILVVGADADLPDAVADIMSARNDIRVVTDTTPMGRLNGHASELAAAHQFILFKAHPDDEGEIEAIRNIAAGRSRGTTLMAIADDDMPLSKARAINSAGVDEVLPRSALREQLPRQIAAFEARRTALVPVQRQSGRVIAVAQARGGVGSTMVAVNLADQIANERRMFGKPRRHSVALVDLDLQFGTIGSALDLPEQDTLLKLAKSGTIPDRTFLEQSMAVLGSGVSVLSAPTDFAPIDSLSGDQVAAIIDVLRDSHEAVVIDLPSALVGWLDPLVRRLDELVVVTDLSVPSIRHARRLIDFLTAENPTLPVSIVVNRDRKTIIGSSLRTEAAKALGRKLEYWLPDDPKTARCAIDRGQVLSQVAPRSSLSQAIGRIAAAQKAKMAGQTLLSA